MIRKLYFVFLSITLSVGISFGQAGSGSIKGSVIDSKSNKPIEMVKVVLYQGGIIKGGTDTDENGKFEFPSITAGSYDVEFRSSEHQPLKLSGVGVSSDQITFLDKTKLSKPDDVLNLEEVEVVAYKVPLIKKDGAAQGSTVTREDIAKLPIRTAAGVAATVGGVNETDNGEISVRGSREGATYYYIDGIKVRGSSNLPKSALEEVQVITGGVPASYGDVTGGIIAVTTRGPSSVYFGSIEGVTSGFYFKGKDPIGYDGKVYGLDNYAYNLVEGMVSGPLWMRKDKDGNKTEPILGFLLSATYNYQKDPRPLAGGSWRIKKEAREALLNEPLRPSSSGSGNFDNSNFLRMDDFEKTKFKMNSQRTVISAAGKIDVNTGPTVNLTFGGSLNYNYGKVYSYYNSLFNFENFGNQDVLDWRVYGRFRQSFKNTTEGSSSKVKSFYYNLMVDYSKSYNKLYDDKHGYDIFNYGHVGYYNTTWEPTFSFNSSGDSLVQDGFKSVIVDYTPSDINPTFAAITSQYYKMNPDPIGKYENLQQINQNGALRNGDRLSDVYGLWYSLGTPYGDLYKSENDQLRVTGSASIVVGGHNISLGVEYEQRWDRGWGSGRNFSSSGQDPIGIWTIARQYMNSHISELDLDNPILLGSVGGYPKIGYNRLNTGYAANEGNGQYGGAAHNDEQYFFDYNFRKEIGLNPAGNDFVDIDEYDPNVFSLDMFSADELFNQGQNFIGYYGYDKNGKKVKGVTDINKYFNDFDENGNYKRFVGAFQPTYIAGYIMDKFSFDNIVFNVGVRVDVFDANQPKLKDPFLFFNARDVREAKKVKSQDPSNYDWVNIPGSMGEDYVVYVNDVTNPTQINGFRSGETWYDANGDQVQDPSVIRGSAGIAPWLTNPSQTTPTADAFEDYKVAINVMPRIAFSFPISDEANFFANYDILTRRPNTGIRFDPIDYQFITTRSGSIINNANLRPEKTIDYSFGFQQVVTRTSSIKVSAFYREQRDMIQIRNLFEAYPSTYKTYGNRDFGTVKGVTIEYDLRRTGNIRLTANYTLQFADGTGSDANSALSFVNSNQPDLRTIYPLSYDQRHSFAFTIDYRYGDGADYNGPSIKGVKLFENMGLNIVTLINSGSPYSKQKNINSAAMISPSSSQMTGTLNGSRKPWTYSLDLQIDRTWELQFGKDENKKKYAYLNVYLRITNLLNHKNVINVYRATGTPNDDGYLAAAEWQNSIQSKLDEQSFRDLYKMSVENPYNYSMPRTIRLGVKFDF